jgi:hypothetical protein
MFLNKMTVQVIEAIKKQGIIYTAGTTLTPAFAIAMIFANNAAIKSDSSTRVILDIKKPAFVRLIKSIPDINAIGKNIDKSNAWTVSVV